jgi:hypothetical protein
MRSIKKLFAPKEVKQTLEILDEAGNRFQEYQARAGGRELLFMSDAYKIVRDVVEDRIFLDPHEFAQYVKNRRDPLLFVYGAIANTAGDLLETGQYHIHRGFLNPLGPGPALLHIFDIAIDTLVQMNDVEPEFADEQRANLRKNIQGAG